MSMGKGWCVTVSRFGDMVVSIGERELAGVDITDEHADLIRGCAWQLLAFVGSGECAWHTDDVGGESMWETGCGHAFEFNDGGPLSNGAAFCSYCGKRLVETRSSDAETLESGATSDAVDPVDG